MCRRFRDRESAPLGPAPSLRRVAGVSLAHLGRSITNLGDLAIPGFYGSELRHHARRLLGRRRRSRQVLATHSKHGRARWKAMMGLRRSPCRSSC